MTEMARRVRLPLGPLWTIALGVAAIGGFSYAVAFAPDSGGATTGTPYADPASYEIGELSSEAVATARSFTDFPVVWLGETFQDFPLTHVERQTWFIPEEESVWDRDTGRDSLLLIYGTCTPDPDELEASCVPPLQARC